VSSTPAQDHGGASSQGAAAGDPGGDGARPQYAMLFQKGSLVSERLVGGAIEAGYNAGQAVPVGDEFWVRTYLPGMVGKGDEFFFNVELLPEAQYYLFSHVAAFIQSGPALNIATKKASGGASGDEQLTGIAFSFMLGLGLDMQIHPDWSLRLAAAGSQGLMKMQLQNEAKTQWLDAGLVRMAQGTASLAYSF
jgi:hypothetical protein